MKAMTRLLMVMTATTMLVACVPALIGGAAVGGYYLGKDDRSADTIARDGAITATVKSKFIGDKYVDAFDINVDTHEGVVTLSGDVTNTIAKGQAEKLARDVNGVREVENQIRLIRKVPVAST